MLSWFESFSGADVYVDLGTANTLVAVRGKGIIVNEPSVIAFQEYEDSERDILAVGEDAKKKLGKTPGDLVADYPLREGVIADYDTTRMMLKFFLSRPGVKSFWRKPKVVISLPYAVSDVEKQAVIRAGKEAGAKDVYLIYEPMAAAIGAGLPVESPQASMIIDVGGGTTEIAVIALAEIITCQGVRIGGHKFDQAIIDYIKRRYSLQIGEQSAEKLKITLGTALVDSPLERNTISGLDSISGLPRSLEITSKDIFDAINPLINDIIQAAHLTLEETPPESISDIIETGIVLAGGGALLKNMSERVEKELKLKVRLDQAPLETIAAGGLCTLDRPALLEKVMITDVTSNGISLSNTKLDLKNRKQRDKLL